MPSNSISTQTCMSVPTSVLASADSPDGYAPITTRAFQPSWCSMSAIKAAYCSSSPISWPLSDTIADSRLR